MKQLVTGALRSLSQLLSQPPAAAPAVDASVEPGADSKPGGERQQHETELAHVSVASHRALKAFRADW